MISSQTYTFSWIQRVNEEQKWGSTSVQFKNYEKMVMALHLLEQLALSGLPFIFKGGTSIILLLQKVFRFSIDIDILISHSLEETELARYLAYVVENSSYFSHYDCDERGNKTKHFRFYYNPFVDDGDESYVLLDICFGNNPYLKTEKTAIHSPLLITEEPIIYVDIPSINCLLADKLTAFAPETIGVPITAEPGKRPKCIEAIKQLYDVGNLFQVSDDTSEIKETFFQVARSEIESRKISISIEDVLDDAYSYAVILASQGRLEVTKYSQLVNGIPGFRRFVTDMSFTDLDAIKYAARVAHLITLIRNNHNGEPIKYDPEINLTDLEISAEGFQDFNRLKEVDPEAFYYWYLALKG